MTKLNEHSEVPSVDADTRSRLASVLDTPGVISAVLFGSQATGRAGPLSDIDIGVWLEPGRNVGERHQLQLALMNAAAEAAGTDEIQLVVLNDATPLMRYQALRDGICLVDRDPRSRIRLETHALLEYLDTAPLRAKLAESVRRRIKDGRFGRR